MEKLNAHHKKIIEYFQKNNPEPKTELTYKNPYELIVAVILSAQCTDKRVNQITPVFFKKFPTIESLSRAQPDLVFDVIKSCSYPNNKVKHLVGMAKMLVNKFNKEIPSDNQLLQKIPGIGRKSANVIASVLFNQPVMPVDTHVFRVSARLGLTINAKTPIAAERQLINKIPERLIPKLHHWLILHGRYICQARKPKCNECGLTKYCIYYSKINYS